MASKITPFPVQEPLPTPGADAPKSRQPAKNSSRKQIFSEELAERICEIIRTDGFPDSKAGQLAGVTGQNVSQWKARYAEFAERLARARLEFQQARLADIRTAQSRDGRPEWRAHVWALEHSREMAEGAQSAPTSSPKAKAHRSTGGEPRLGMRVSTAQLADLQRRRRAALEQMTKDAAAPRREAK